MITQEANNLSLEQGSKQTENLHQGRDRTNIPTITYAQAQLIVKQVISQINTGRGRKWSKSTAA